MTHAHYGNRIAKILVKFDLRADYDSPRSHAAIKDADLFDRAQTVCLFDGVWMHVNPPMAQSFVRMYPGQVAMFVSWLPVKYFNA